MTRKLSASWFSGKNPAAPNAWPVRRVILSMPHCESSEDQMSISTTSMSGPYSVDPFSPVMYDLTVNSDRSPVEAAIEAILAAVGQLAETTSP